MYKTDRKSAKLSIEEAAFKLNIATRTLCNYEAGKSIPPPETVLAMSEEYRSPKLTRWYCRTECAIGQAYCYELLNNVDLSPMAIITKYRQEEREAAEAIENLALLMLNRSNRASCTEDELEQIERWSLELLDLEHVIETLKLRLWSFIDVKGLVRKHNNKCIEKRYYVPEKTAC